MKVSEEEKKNQITLSLIEGVGDKIGKVFKGLIISLSSEIYKKNI